MYTPERVGKIGLDHHVAEFRKEEICGEMLLEATDWEMPQELKVTNCAEKLKIKVRRWGDNNGQQGGLQNVPHSSVA